MLFLLQILFALTLTILYTIKQVTMFDYLSILSILVVFFIALIAYMILLFAFYIPFIYITEKMDKKSKFKHIMVNLLGKYIFLDLFRVKLEITGKENIPTNSLFVMYANHIEYTDPIYVRFIFGKFPLAFVAKEPLFKVILVKNILSGIGCVPITKNADRSAMKSIIESIKIVKEGQPMGIFPEGMRTYSNTLTEFKPGAFKLAMKASADIVPVCLYNMHGILKKNRIRTHKAYVHVFPPIKFDDYKDLDSVTIAENVKKIINDKLDEYKKLIPEDVKVDSHD